MTLLKLKYKIIIKLVTYLFNILIDFCKTFFCLFITIQGKPILKVSGNNCTLQFEWKTSLVCSRKLVVEFDKDMCAATIKRPSQNVKNNTIIDFNNILIINNVSLKLIFISRGQIIMH